MKTLPSSGSPQGLGRLVELDRDHPGFRDVEYRRRRDEIARAALEYVEGAPVPVVGYTPDEHACWREVWDHLSPLHDERACASYLACSEVLRLPRDEVPQLAWVNERLEETTGFRMLPVAGLIDPRTFLDYLGRGVFLATQYMRHHSRPLYTPEPDVVHELVGHAATLMEPEFCALNRAFGRAVQGADEARTLELIRVYWWTIEFGLVDEGTERRAYGAGLLSSYGELGAIHEADHRGFDLDEMASTPFDPTDYQGVLFVAPSWETMLSKVRAFLER